MKTAARAFGLLTLMSVAACATTPEHEATVAASEPPAAPPAIASEPVAPAPAAAPAARGESVPKLQDLFPGVRADLAAKVVEFDAKTSPMLVDDPQAPLFFVETLVCSPDTREHESLLVTSVKPSHLHAALLAVGLVRGAPGLFKFESGRFVPVDASGDRVSITVLPQRHSVVTGDAEVKIGAEPTALPAAKPDRFDPDPRTWLIHVADRGKADARRFGTDTTDANHSWVFAGSSMRKVTDKAGNAAEMYDADGAGVVIGLCCFGSEVIAWSRTFSPDASISEPEWIADFTKTPPPGTRVRIRVQKAAK